jgi:hypothetical protein
LGQVDGLAAIPIQEREVTHTVGLVVADREPLTPSARELARIASQTDVSAALGKRTPAPS